MVGAARQDLAGKPHKVGATGIERAVARLHAALPATAKDAVRAARTLYSWDFLLGVQDITRQGGAILSAFNVLIASLEKVKSRGCDAFTPPP